jgi:hypothetical protein
MQVKIELLCQRNVSWTSVAVQDLVSDLEQYHL